MKITYNRLVYFLSFCMMFTGVSGFIFTNMTNVTIFNSFLYITSFVLLIYLINNNKVGYFNDYISLKIFFILSLLVLLYSLIVAEKYEQWRYLFTVYVPFLLLPILSIFGAKLALFIPLFMGVLFSNLGLSLFFWINEEGSGIGTIGMNDYVHYISLIYLYLLLKEYITTSLYILLILISISAIIYDIDVRTNFFNIIFVVSVLFSRKLLNTSLFTIFLKNFRRILLFIPILFFVLGSLNIFNLFQFFDSFNNPVQLSYGDKTTFLNKDTRTGIYKDAILALAEDGKFIWGISATGLHKTSLSEVYYDTLKDGRMGSEVGILEYFLRGGIIFCISTFYLYSKSSYLAIYISNNIFSKLLGIYISFRWFLMFIEAQPFFNSANVITFMAIGIALNRDVRKLSDVQVRNKIKQFFFNE